MPSKPPSEMTREELASEAGSLIFKLRCWGAPDLSAVAKELASRLAAAEQHLASIAADDAYSDKILSMTEAQLNALVAKNLGEEGATMLSIEQKKNEWVVKAGIEKGLRKRAEAECEQLRAQLATTEAERDAAREDSTLLAAKIRNVVPYVVATLPIGIAEEWGRVHTGRAQSSLRQLQSLLDAARRAADEGEG